MTPLYDRHGHVYAWLDKPNGRIFGLDGKHRALIRGDRVHDYRGRHLGWWEGDHFRDRRGAVGLFERGAQGLGVIPPIPRIPPIPPMRALPPLPGLPTLPSIRPIKQMQWAAELPF